MKPVKTVFFLLVLAVQFAKAQDTSVVVSANMFDKFTDQLSLANKEGWIFRPGNDSNWAQPHIDTAGWIKMNQTTDLKKYADKNDRVEGWFRIKLKFDSSLLTKELWIDFANWAATQFYIDGKLMATRGNTGDNGKPFEEYNDDLDPLAFTINSDTVHTFAIHFVGYLSPFPPHDLKYKLSSSDLFIIDGPNPLITISKVIAVIYSFFNTWLVTCAVLSLLFWLLAFQNRREKNLVLIALCTSFYTLLSFAQAKNIAIGLAYYLSFYIYGQITKISLLLILLTIPVLLIRIFKRRLSRKLIIFLVTLFILYLLLFFCDIPKRIGSIMDTVFILFSLSISMYYIISSWKNLRGAQWAMVVGLFFSLFILCLFVVYLITSQSSNYYVAATFLSCFVLSFPLSLLVYVSMRFKEMIREVRVNADRVVQLSEEKRVQAENQQQMLQEEVNRQTAEIRHTLDNLKATQKQLIQSEKMASLGELTAGIAHEIQNPLNFVNNFSEVNSEMIDELKNELATGNLQLANEIADDIKSNEQKINHHGKRADAIVKSMLEHSRTSTGVKEPTDINKLADEYLRLAYHGLRAKDKHFNVEIKTHFDENIGKINLVSQDIGRVLLNLFNNAFYACAERSRSTANQQKSGNPISYNPTVSVNTKKTDNHVIITVSDNGKGIPQNIIDKIFQPFFTTKPTGQGTGLGLSLSYDIIKAHDGEIKVDSKEGEGTTFIIELASK
ncbi:MAG: ATP-binding protein [Bacteroidota bacterium]|nr:ATP-binding protein [Bacteroidota bacterium]